MSEDQPITVYCPKCGKPLTKHPEEGPGKYKCDTDDFQWTTTEEGLLLGW
jgi:hypothetical protein